MPYSKNRYVLTKAQRKALFNLFERSLESTRQNYRQFRKSAQPSFGTLMVPFCGMWVGIEEDGYTHS